MAYTTINKSSDYFNTKLYTGNGSTNAITGVGFQPDWVWLKDRSASSNHQLYDAVRGASKELASNLTNAEGSTSGRLSSFDTDGFTLGSGGTVNANGNNFVSWNWKANGQGSANSDGTITTTYNSVNTTAGISIIKWTGDGTNTTVGHGLGKTPAITIRKDLSASSPWYVHTNLYDGSHDYLLLNTYDAASNSSSSGFTPTVVDVGNGSSTYIMYAFTDITGYSKFGRYTGNGNVDGPFVYTGFKPAWLMFKKGDGSAANWQMWDNKRDPENPVEEAMHADSNSTPSSDQDIDFLSNGFKIRSSQHHLNNSGSGFIYMCFAEAPLVGSNNVPCTAR